MHGLAKHVGPPDRTVVRTFLVSAGRTLMLLALAFVLILVLLPAAVAAEAAH